MAGAMIMSPSIQQSAIGEQHCFAACRTARATLQNQRLDDSTSRRDQRLMEFNSTDRNSTTSLVAIYQQASTMSSPFVVPFLGQYRVLSHMSPTTGTSPSSVARPADLLSKYVALPHLLSFQTANYNDGFAN